MLRQSGFRSALATIWFRLITLAIVGMVFAEALLVGRSRDPGLDVLSKHCGGCL